MQALGHHLLLDLWGVGPLLDDPDALKTLLETSARAGGATVVESRFHQFSPQGVSGVIILAESHLALHTWPERDVASVDVFTCGSPELTRAVADQVVARLQPTRHTMHLHERGVAAPASAMPVDTTLSAECAGTPTETPVTVENA